MRRRWQFRALRGVAALAAACVALAAAAAGPAPKPANPAELRQALRVGARPLVVHVWATWCRPCVAEWPALAETLRGAAPRADVVTIALDEPSRGRLAARLLADAGGVPGRAFLAAPGDAFGALRALDPEWDGAIPATYLLAPGGAIVLAQRGGTRLRALAEALERQTEHGARGARDVAGERRRP